MSSFDFLAHDLLDRDLVFAVGGYDGKQALATTEVFSLATSRWEPGPPMRAGRRSFGTAVHRNWLFVIGGYNDGCLASVEFLSLPACTWREGPRLTTKRRE